MYKKSVLFAVTNLPRLVVLQNTVVMNARKLFLKNKIWNIGEKRKLLKLH